MLKFIVGNCSRVDDANIPFYDVPKPRNLIYAFLSHELAERSDAWVIPGSPPRTAGLGIGIHASKFIDVENLAILSDPPLRVDDGAGTLKFDFRSNNCHGNSEHNQGTSAARDIERALYKTIA